MNIYEPARKLRHSLRWYRRGRKEVVAIQVKLFGRKWRSSEGTRRVFVRRFTFAQDDSASSPSEADGTGKRIPSFRECVTRRIENSACHPVNAVSRFRIREKAALPFPSWICKCWLRPEVARYFARRFSAPLPLVGKEEGEGRSEEKKETERRGWRKRRGGERI